ncbi:hypothetical protein BS78_02G384900 [Paspalum vaginatum]|nr:hypothetical protein BS78_02G384900 [Paspalum vaginatum]
MAYRVLEVTLLSAKDLKRVNLISRMEVYAVVTISGDPLTRQCTQPDPYGGRHPSWNTTFRFNVPPTVTTATGCLHVLLRTERALGDRDVGEAIVPLADILAAAACDPGPRPPQLASYQVRKVHRCEPRGMLNVSYRLGPIVAPQHQAGPAPVPDEALHFVGRPVPLPFYPPPIYGYQLPRPSSSLPLVPSPSVQAAGHPPPPAAGAGHAAAHHLPPTKGKTSDGKLDFGMGLGAGLVSGAIGGMLAAGDIMSESDAAAYSYGYRAGLADGGAAAVYKTSRMPQVYDKVEPNRAKIA